MRQLLNCLLNWKLTLSTFLYRLVAIATLLFATQMIGALPAQATSIYSIPTVSAGEPTWVIDDAEVLSRVTEGQISSTFQALADQTSREVRFVTIHHLDYGETIQSFADDLFERWFPNPEARSNQVLLVLDNVSNNSAIRTGSEIKTTMSDEVAESVATETLQVPLRNGDKYNQAFSEAADRLVAVLSGQPDPGPPTVQDDFQVEGTFATAEETQKTRNNSTIVVIALLIAATVIPMVTYFLYVGGGS